MRAAPITVYPLLLTLRPGEHYGYSIPAGLMSTGRESGHSRGKDRLIKTAILGQVVIEIHPLLYKHLLHPIRPQGGGAEAVWINLVSDVSSIIIGLGLEVGVHPGLINRRTAG